MINNDEVVNKKLTTTKYNQVVKKNIPQVSAPPKPTYNAPRVKASIQPVYEMANWTKVKYTYKTKFQLAMMTSSIKILQYNIQSLKSNKNYVDLFNSNNNIDIVCLQEIFSHDNQTTIHNLFNFNLLRKTRTDGYGGVGIGFRKDIRHGETEYATPKEAFYQRNQLYKPSMHQQRNYYPPHWKQCRICNRHNVHKY
ncbi:PREDICTED: uncharacterized protein LOC108369487 [Rhagoletis zephyria]|uniref:uncharacterized protein LOC108369487 n=1 Tax=Rhagoletis zephyria TaxID=28612 RepID=UPI0008119454|nr:PREDICTED: uncharacterized protein LOC108369487 [Rhagoletis zephyria]